MVQVHAGHLRRSSGLHQGRIWIFLFFTWMLMKEFFCENEMCGECIGVRVLEPFAFSNLPRWPPPTVIRWLISTPSHISCVLWRAYKRGTWPILEQLCTGFLAFWMYNVLHLTSIVTVQSIPMPTHFIPFTSPSRISCVLWIRNLIRF